jgi:hypothetical protein
MIAVVSGAGAGRADHAHARHGFIHGNMAKPFGTWSPPPTPCVASQLASRRGCQ